MISGVRIVGNNGVTADTFYVGDLSKYRIRIAEDIMISIGYDGDDWTTNMVTPLAEMMAGAYIPQNQYGAIVKGDFTTAAAALETP